MIQNHIDSPVSPFASFVNLLIYVMLTGYLWYVKCKANIMFYHVTTSLPLNQRLGAISKITSCHINEHLVHNKKLCTYAQIKLFFKFEAYVDIINDFKRRQCFSKLRMSAHNLEIEAGRFRKNMTPRHDRHCKYCLSIGTKTIGNEIHFVMVCPQFQEERKFLETKIADLYPNVSQLSVQNKFIWLLSQEDKYCLNLLAAFFLKCFKIKSEFQIYISSVPRFTYHTSFFHHHLVYHFI